jgi:hypothetical protein
MTAIGTPRPATVAERLPRAGDGNGVARRLSTDLEADLPGTDPQEVPR